MIRASSAGVSHGGHLGMVYVPTPEATNHQPSAVVAFPLSAVSKKNAARISANTAVHSHAIAAWWCLRGAGIEDKMELLEDAGYLAFWVRLRLCDFQHGMRRTFSN